MIQTTETARNVNSSHDGELTFTFKGRCVGGEVNLSRYPNLAHSSDKGVFTHLAGVSIEDVAEGLALEDWGCRVIVVLDELAKKLGVHLDELCDAIRYARANKLV